MLASFSRLRALRIFNVLKDLCYWVTSVKDLFEEQLEHKDLLEGCLKFNQAHLNIDHLQVFLSIELLAKHYISWVEKHQPLVLLRNLYKCGAFSIRE